MSRFCLTMLFSVMSVAGLGLVLYALLAGGRRRNSEPIEADRIGAGLGDSAGEPGGVLDLDIGHEGLKHWEKKPFNPDKHKPEPIEARKKSS